MQSVGGTSLLSRSVTVTVVSKTYRRTRDKRALSIAGQGEGRWGQPQTRPICPMVQTGVFPSSD
jgi:hypothetical protein